jgi:hypothetical protein
MPRAAQGDEQVLHQVFDIRAERAESQQRPVDVVELVLERAQTRLVRVDGGERDETSSENGGSRLFALSCMTSWACGRKATPAGALPGPVKGGRDLDPGLSICGQVRFCRPRASARGSPIFHA